MGTNKGYTGQYADPLSGFDYYNARYYDPVCGTFLSADPVQGNMQGMNPYAYVNGNPETYTDPTGNMYAPPGGAGGGGNGGGGGTPPPSCQGWCWIQQQWDHYVAPEVNHYIIQPAEHLLQQAQEQVLRTFSPEISVVHILIGVTIAAAVGIGSYVVWQVTHRDPNWTDIASNEGVSHTRWLWGKEPYPGTVPSATHVIEEHVDITNPDLRKKAKSSDHMESKFDSLTVAQLTVDYALDHMTLAQRIQYLWMTTNPLGRFGPPLVLTGDTGVPLGYELEYNPSTGKLTKYTGLTRYNVVIGIDFKTGQPYIITAYPTR